MASHHAPNTQIKTSNGTNLSSRNFGGRPSEATMTPATKVSANGVLTTSPQSSRRGSWLQNLSSKFGSSNSTSTLASQQLPLPNTSVSSEKPKSANYAQGQQEIGNVASITLLDGRQDAKPSPASQPGFLISTLRKLSVPSVHSSPRGGSAAGKGVSQGGRVERIVMNKSVNRDKCQIAELDLGKLRRVTFCVDVEVAGPPVGDEREEKLRKEERKRARKAEKAEKAEREKKETMTVSTARLDGTEVTKVDQQETERKDDFKDKPQRKETKKKKSNNAPSVTSADAVASREQHAIHGNNNGVPVDDPRAISEPVQLAQHQAAIEKPITDPSRIYKRCCQLREVEPVSRIVQALSNPRNRHTNTPHVLTMLDISGCRLPYQDVAALGDFLALVPVFRLNLSNCDLTDEGIRVILSGLLAVKIIKDQHVSDTNITAADATNTALASKSPQNKIVRHAVERLDLSCNTKVGKEGWKFISCFIHVCRSIKALDLTSVPFPPAPTGLSPGASHDSITQIFSKALSERLAGVGILQEVNLGNCSLSVNQVQAIIGGISNGKIRCVGLAGNNLTHDSLLPIVQLLKDGELEILDLSQNHISNHIDMLASAMTPVSPLMVLILGGCDINPENLEMILPALSQLPDLRYLDLSDNPRLFSTQPDAISILRHHLPQLSTLKRLHLSNTSMNLDHVIALTEILPEIPTIAHVSVTRNPDILPVSRVNDGINGAVEASAASHDEEEGAALWTAFIAAAKTSTTLVSIDTDYPLETTSPSVKALAKRFLHFTLRNLESGATDFIKTLGFDDRSQSELVRLTSIAEPSAPQGVDDDDWEEDFLFGGTGVVKALGVCLMNKVRTENGASPLNSGTGSLEHKARVKGFTMNLLERARKVKAKIQPALREAQLDNQDEMVYRRLFFLDETLSRVIQKFEEEFPETKVLTPPPTPDTEHKALNAEDDELSKVMSSVSGISDEGDPTSIVHTDHPLSHMHRTGSNVSLASKRLENEEGQMLRFHSRVSSQFNHHHPREMTAEEYEKFAEATGFIDVGGEEIRNMVVREGVEGLQNRGFGSKQDMAEFIKLHRKEDPDQSPSEGDGNEYGVDTDGPESDVTGLTMSMDRRATNSSLAGSVATDAHVERLDSK